MSHSGDLDDIIPSEGTPTSVVGSCEFFELVAIKGGNFFHRTITTRISPSDLSVFSCIQNTNLQALRRRDKGFCIMIKVGEFWKLHVTFYCSPNRIILLRWKGDTIHQAPQHLFQYPSENAGTSMAAHFDLIDLVEYPKPCYWVNLLFPGPTFPPVWNLHNNHEWMMVNAVDGCFDQFPQGPTQLKLSLNSNFRDIIYAAKKDMPPNDSEMPGNYETNINDVGDIADDLKLPAKKKKRHHGVKPWLRKPDDDASFHVIYLKKRPENPSFRKKFCAPLTIQEGWQRQRAACPSGWVLRWFGEFRDVNDIPNGQILLDNHINTMEDFDRPPIDAIKLTLCFEGGNLRVQLIHCEETWNAMKNDPEVFKFEWGDNEAYFQETKKSPMFLKGMNVSNWTMSDETMAANGLTYEDTVAIYRIYKIGYGSRARARTGPGCCNIYGGCRDSAQASCSPNSGPGMSHKQQYYSQKWARDGSEFERAMLEKKMHLLPTYASILQGSFNYSRFVGLDMKQKQLVTQGVPGTTYGFYNESHCDYCDLITNREECDQYLQKLNDEDCRNEHQEAILAKLRETCELNGGVAIPTFCGYTYLFENPSDAESTDVYQHFHYPEYGIASRIFDGSGHWMLASCFYHHTSLCRLVLSGVCPYSYWKKNAHAPAFNLLAWGTKYKDQIGAVVTDVEGPDGIRITRGSTQLGQI